MKHRRKGVTERLDRAVFGADFGADLMPKTALEAEERAAGAGG